MKEKEKIYKKKLHDIQRKFRLEAGIRSASIGLSISLTAAVLVLVYGRFFQKILMTRDALFLAVGLFLVASVLVYGLLLRPGKKEILAEADALGLQERMITMEELAGREDLIARKQRQDAMDCLSELEIRSKSIRLYRLPLLWSFVMLAATGLLVLLPVSGNNTKETASQTAETELVDELVSLLRTLIEVSEVNSANKENLHSVIDALALSFVPEDTTLSRTAKIATASKRLDLLEAEAEGRLELLRKEEKTEEGKQQLALAELEQDLLTETIDAMQDMMGTSLEEINKLGGTFWSPEGPKSSSTNGEMQEGEKPPEDGEPVEGEDVQGEPDSMMGGGTEQIYDPEQGEVSYGTVYETYYAEIMKALTETEFPEDLRKLIEEYANTLE